MPIGTYYAGALTAKGAQHWFYTQADRNGQMTVHLDVPDNVTIDYDLYVYRYEPATGYLYGFQESINNPTVAEHISFTTTTGSYFFINVQSYQGSSTTQPYILQVEMASVGVGEVDDLPSLARTLPANASPVKGQLSMRTDEDYLVTTAPGNKIYVNFEASANVVVDVFRANSNSTLTHLVTLAPRAKGFLNSVATITKDTAYYFRVRHANNINARLDDNYSLSTLRFDIPDGIGYILGENLSGTKVAYVTNRDDLWVNDTKVQSNLTANLKLDHHDIKTTNLHSSYADGAISHAEFGTYTGGAPYFSPGTVSNALMIYIRSDYGIRFTNSQTKYPNGVASTVTQMGVDRNPKSGYVVDLSSMNVNTKIVDLASKEGNGYYNNFFNTGRTCSFVEK